MTSRQSFHKFPSPSFTRIYAWKWRVLITKLLFRKYCNSPEEFENFTCSKPKSLHKKKVCFRKIQRYSSNLSSCENEPICLLDIIFLDSLAGVGLCEMNFAIYNFLQYFIFVKSILENVITWSPEGTTFNTTTFNLKKTSMTGRGTFLFLKLLFFCIPRGPVLQYDK